MRNPRRALGLTAAERDAWDRYQRWRSYLGEVAATNVKIRQSAAQREAELAKLRLGCEVSHRDIKARCAAARKKIRSAARQRAASLRAHKRAERDWYSATYGKGAPKRARMTRDESDSLAEHNIPDELIPIWRRDRTTYPYDLAPDMRAEKFLEWAEAHETEIRGDLADLLEASWDDLAYARDEQAREQREEVVPF